MPLKHGSDYTGPSALDEVLAKTDPRLGDVYRQNGFPDLPRYASQLGAGAIESASLGMLKAPQDPTTTPEVLLRGAGHLLGSSFIPLGPTVKLAGKLGMNKTAAGLVANVAATEIREGGEAELSQIILDGAFGALYGKMSKAKQGWWNTGSVRNAGSNRAFVKDLEEGGLLRDPSAEFHMPESGAEKTLRMADETMRGKAPREFQTTTFRKLARTHPDPDIRRFASRVENFHDKVRSQINVEDINNARTVSLGDAVPNDLNPDHSLAQIIREAQEDRPLLRMAQTGITRGYFGSAIRPPKAVMMGVEHKTGGQIRAYSDVFEPATNARRLASDEIGKVGKDVTNLIGKAQRPRQQAMLRYVMTPESERGVMGESLGLTAAERDAAERTSRHIGDLFERNFPGEKWDEYVTQIAPRLQKATPQQLEQLRNHRTAGELLNYAAASELNLRSNQLDSFAAGHIRALSMMHHFDPVYKKVASGVVNKEYPPEYREYLANWLQGLRGTDSSFAKAFNPHYKNFLTSLGLDATDGDVRSVVNGITQLTHAGLIGFRPGPLIRNLFNTWQTGSRIGLDWVWRGMKKAMTQEGWSIAKKGGMIEEEVLHEVEGLRELTSSRAARVPARIAELGLRPYGKIDDFNRATIYLGMRDRFLSAVRQAGGNEDQLLTKGGLYRFHPVIRDQVLSEWRVGNAERAAHLIGTHAAQDTQWVYQSGFRPTGMSGELNRAFLQFGVWPANYLEYMRQMATLPNTPTIEKVKWMGEWALGNAGIVATFGAAGATVGMGPEALWHTLPWTFVGPASYAGGPLLDLAHAAASWEPSSAVKGIYGGGDLTEAALKSEFGRKARDYAMGMMPGSGLVRDIAKAKGTGAGMVEDAMGQDAMKMAGMAYSNDRPAQSPEQELFRVMTGVRRK